MSAETTDGETLVIEPVRNALAYVALRADNPESLVWVRTGEGGPAVALVAGQERARVFRAAPDLLRALEAVANTIATNGRRFCHYCNAWVESEPHRDYCVVAPALAKANGEAVQP